MKRTSVFLAGAIALFTTSHAAAQERKFQLALRSGYGIPMGNALVAGREGAVSVSRDVKMNDLFSYRIPIWVDAGYMLTANFMLGIYFQYGLVGVKTREAGESIGCASGYDCSGHDIHYGIQAHYYFLPGETANPWLGLGFGRESLTIDASGQGQSGSIGLSGWTLALIQAGVDFRVSDGVAIGPFAAFSIGQHSTFDAEDDGISVSNDIPTATHEWLTFGAKGQFGF